MTSNQWDSEAPCSNVLLVINMSIHSVQWKICSAPSIRSPKECNTADSHQTSLWSFQDFPNLQGKHSTNCAMSPADISNYGSSTSAQPAVSLFWDNERRRHLLHVSNSIAVDFCFGVDAKKASGWLLLFDTNVEKPVLTGILFERASFSQRAESNKFFSANKLCTSKACS